MRAIKMNSDRMGSPDGILVRRYEKDVVYEQGEFQTNTLFDIFLKEGWAELVGAEPPVANPPTASSEEPKEKAPKKKGK